MDLAKHLGISLQELHRTMSSEEYTYWLAYRQKYYFAQERLEAILAMGFATLTNCWVKKRVSANDFLPKEYKEKVIIPYKDGHHIIGAFLKAIGNKNGKPRNAKSSINGRRKPISE